jgi:hypothetical protein
VRARAFDTIVLGGLVAGALDILDAFVLTWANGGSAVRVLQFIASGVLGSGALQGGWTTAGLGLVLHFVIALGAAAVFLGITRLIPAVLRHPVSAGVAFGLGVFLVMNLIVLPLAGFAGGLPRGWRLVNGLLIHAFGVGLPIAWFASRSVRAR